jgi:hypothetical protein
MLAARVTAAICAMGVAGCTLLEGPREISAAPSSVATIAAVRAAAKDGKLPEPIEATDAVQAHPAAPGDWVVCVKSSAPDSAIYAVFFTGDQVKETRRPARVDPCWSQPYRQLAR